MKQQKFSGFLFGRLEFIQNQQLNGYTLPHIHLQLQAEWGQAINYASFLTILSRVRQKKRKLENDKKEVQSMLSSIKKEKDEGVLIATKIDKKNHQSFFSISTPTNKDKEDLI